MDPNATIAPVPCTNPDGHEIDCVSRVCHHCSNKIPGRSLRELMLRQGLESELQGWRLTGKVRPCFSIVRDEYGLRKRGKLQNYIAFCAILGEQPAAFEPNPAKPGKYRRVRTEVEAA